MLPILFSLNLFGKTINIYSYGVFLLLAMAAAVLVFYWLLKKRQISTARIFDNILTAILAGLVGARLFYILFHFRFYLGNWREIFKFWQGGLDFFGAAAGGFLALGLWLYFKKRKELWAYLDCGAIVLMFGHSIGMIGSFLIGSDFGRPSLMPLAVKFPALADNVLRHPSQIYEALAYFAIFIILFLLFKKSPNLRPGFIFFASLIFFGAARFFLEFFRGPDIILYTKVWDFTLAHLLSLIVLIIGIMGIRWHSNQNLK